MKYFGIILCMGVCAHVLSVQPADASQSASLYIHGNRRPPEERVESYGEICKTSNMPLHEKKRLIYYIGAVGRSDLSLAFLCADTLAEIYTALWSKPANRIFCCRVVGGEMSSIAHVQSGNGSEADLLEKKVLAYFVEYLNNFSSEKETVILVDHCRILNVWWSIKTGTEDALLEQYLFSPPTLAVEGDGSCISSPDNPPSKFVIRVSLRSEAAMAA